MPQETHRETLGFQAEIAQLLDLMIHSLYSNKDIFLREIISNASDAIDRLRFAALSDERLYEGDSDFRIQVSFDKDARTITVRDNGIGMSRDDVVEHIGTIAKSGTREFLQSLTGDQQKDANLIGQFGVGFYSAFVVADRVTLTSRRAGLPAEQGVFWESEGRGEYVVETAEIPARGTTIVLHLRAGEDELLSGSRLRGIIRKYSDHITVPIMMPIEHKDSDADGEQGGEEQVNQASALWARPKSAISDEEYTEFYRHVAHAYDEPLLTVHSRMEGTQEYILLLYIPKQAPFDLWNREQRHGIKLYVRRVFIMDDAEQLLPGYLRFVRGIVDSSDLPLNVSREILQHNRIIDVMRSNAVKKLLGALADLEANDSERYATFWKTFGRVFKEGLAEDGANREAIAKLLRFASTMGEGEEQTVSFQTYVERMKPGQDKIYYLAAESYGAAAESPLLEIFTKKGVEVLLLSDPVDYLLGTELEKFGDTPLQSIAQGAIAIDQLPDVEPGETPVVDDIDLKPLLGRLRAALVEQVKDVRATTRLTSSPAVLVNDEHDLDPQLQRLLKAVGQPISAAKPILEVNPRHPIVRKMQGTMSDERFKDWALVLFDQCVLSRGDQLEHPIRFVNRLNELLA